MNPIKVLLLGVGQFGITWARDVIPKCADCCTFAAAVDRQRDRLDLVPPGVARFTDLDEALETVHPDLVLNVTPPDLHTHLNLRLLSLGYPVLCEKPLAGSMDEAEALLAHVQQQGGFLMIADNYRYAPVMRACRRYIAAGALGAIHAVQCHFRRSHPDFSQFYHGRLDQPLLLDVTVHHLDVARYLTGEEPVRTRCETWNAPHAWYQERPASAVIWSEMTGNVRFSYFGTLAAPESTTDWNGNWEIECDRGVLQIIDSKLYLWQDGVRTPLATDDSETESRILMLREAICAVRERHRGETDLTDNIKTFRWVQDAIQSSAQKTGLNEKGAIS